MAVSKKLVFGATKEAANRAQDDNSEAEFGCRIATQMILEYNKLSELGSLNPRIEVAHFGSNLTPRLAQKRN